MNDRNRKPSRFRIFNFQKDGKGVSKDEVLNEKPNLKGFFKLYKDSISRLLTVNIMMVIGCLPVLLAILAASDLMMIEYTAPNSDFYSVIHSTLVGSDTFSAADLALIGTEGIQLTLHAPSTWTYVFYGTSLLTFLTFGLVNVGSAYVLRQMVSRQPVFMVSDFFYAIRRNWKQALPFGMLDLLLLILIPANVFILLTSGTSFLFGFLFWCNIIFGVLYFIMRFYIYLQMVTFDLSVFKILKNSLIFSMLGLKRNLMALLGILALVLINVLCIFGFGGILLPIGIAFPFMILFSHSAFMATYAAYFKIKEIMIDPLLAEEQAQDAPAEESQA